MPTSPPAQPLLQPPPPGVPAFPPPDDVPALPPPQPGEAQAFLQPLGEPQVRDGLSTADLHHPSAMLPRLGLFLRLFAWIFFKPVHFPQRLGQELAAHAREGVVVYAGSTISLLDYLYFNYALSRAQLPLARFANGVDLTWFQPWRRALATWFRRVVLRKPHLRSAEVLHGHLRRRHAVLIFLRRGFSLVDLLTPRPQVAYLSELIESQRELPFPILIVPQVLVWQRNPDKSRASIIDEFFGDPDAPGRIRKLFSFLLNHRRATVQLGQAIDVRAFLAEHADVHDEGLLTERLRHLVTQSFKTEDRVIRGAPIKPPWQLREEILASGEVAADLARLAAETRRPLAVVRREADENLKEIGANYSMPMLSFLSFVLTLLWARIYEGIEVDEEGLERIREVGRRAPVIVVPSHKSHIDYLIISYLFYRHGLIPPHIAAGANLSFFPLGTVFRRAGAFFLRRSFHGQPVYAAVFRHYMRKLLADGHWLEFFPEGGRSRTGKLLPPKFGLIKHVLEGVADGVTHDVALVPANFGYERLIEEKAYKKELEGGEKKAENVGEILKATSILVHKYGRIRIQFGEPMSARQILMEHGAMGPEQEPHAAWTDGHGTAHAGPGAVATAAAPARDPKAFDRAVKVCGYQILGGINAAAVLTPTAVVAAVLLTKIQKGISRGDLLLRVGYLLDVAGRRGAVLSEALVTAMKVRRQQLRLAEAHDAHRHAPSGGVPDPLGEDSERARRVGEAVAAIVDKVLLLFEQSKWVVRKHFNDEDVFIVKKAGRLHLDYYKNNMIHLFVPDALLAASVLAVQQDSANAPPGASSWAGGSISGSWPATASMEPAALADMTKFLSRLLKFEFVYAPGVTFERQYEATLADFCAAGWMTSDLVPATTGEAGTAPGRLRLTSSVTPVVRLYAKLIQNFIESYSLMARALAVLQKAPMAEKAFLDHVQTEAEKAYDLGDVQCYEAISKVNLSNALKIFVELGYVRSHYEGQGKKRVKVLTVQLGEGTGAQLAGYMARIQALHAPWRSDKG